jgi:hypothetical protein
VTATTTTWPLRRRRMRPRTPFSPRTIITKREEINA